jgi:biotin carboxyl carrier protein
MIPFPGTYHGGAGDEATVMVPLTRLSLSAISGPLRGGLFQFDGVEMVIGRAENCAVSIPSKGVSRHHARIEFQNGSYWLIPDKTVNGTRLNGVLVQAPCQLSDRDQIAIYDSTFVVAYRDPGADKDFDDAGLAPPPSAHPPTPQVQPLPPMYPQAGPPGMPQTYPVYPQGGAPEMPPSAPPPRGSLPASAYPQAQPGFAPMVTGYPAPPPGYAQPAQRPIPMWMWVVGIAGFLVLVAGVVIVTIKVMQPSQTAQAPAAVPPPVAVATPPAPTPAPAQKAAATPDKPATPDKAKQAPPPKLVGVLAVETTKVVAAERGTLIDIVKEGTAVARGGAVGHHRMFSAAFNQAYEKLKYLERKFGNSEEHADFIAQARQDFIIAQRRRVLKPITADAPGTITKVLVKPGAEITDHEVVAEISVARITAPVAAVDGTGKKCTVDVAGKQLTGTLLAVGSTERTLELDSVPDAPPGDLGEVKIHCASD